MLAAKCRVVWQNSIRVESMQLNVLSIIVVYIFIFRYVLCDELTASQPVSQPLYYILVNNFHFGFAFPTLLYRIEKRERIMISRLPINTSLGILLSHQYVWQSNK